MIVRHESTTEMAVKPSKLLQSAGWLAVLLMLVLASPGIRFERVVEAPSVARLQHHP